MSTPDFGPHDIVKLASGQTGKVIALTGNGLVWHRSTKVTAHVHLDGGPVVTVPSTEVVEVITSALDAAR